MVGEMVLDGAMSIADIAARDIPVENWHAAVEEYLVTLVEVVMKDDESPLSEEELNQHCRLADALDLLVTINRIEGCSCSCRAKSLGDACKELVARFASFNACLEKEATWSEDVYRLAISIGRLELALAAVLNDSLLDSGVQNLKMLREALGESRKLMELLLDRYPNSPTENLG